MPHHARIKAAVTGNSALVIAGLLVPRDAQVAGESSRDVIVFARATKASKGYAMGVELVGGERWRRLAWLAAG
jgi:hypothetical protein